MFTLVMMLFVLQHSGTFREHLFFLPPQLSLLSPSTPFFLVIYKIDVVSSLSRVNAETSEVSTYL